MNKLPSRKEVKAWRAKDRALGDKNIKDRALFVIEDMCLDDSFGLSKSPYAKLLTQIYTYAHVANGGCQNPHKDWVKELNKHWKAIR